jgi:hypothetical protein
MVGYKASQGPIPRGSVVVLISARHNADKTKCDTREIETAHCEHPNSEIKEYPWP